MRCATSDAVAIANQSEAISGFSKGRLLRRKGRNEEKKTRQESHGAVWKININCSPGTVSELPGAAGKTGDFSGNARHARIATSDRTDS